MASISSETRNGQTIFRLTFQDNEGKRQRLRLGGIPQRDAERIATYVEDMLTAKELGREVKITTARWLNSISGELYDKLASVGLVEMKVRWTLKQWLAHFHREQSKKVGTYCQNNLARSEALLLQYRPGEMLLADFTAEDAAGFRKWLEAEGYAKATVAGHIKKAKQYFRAAAKAGALEASPFAEVVAGDMSNEERAVYVSTEDIEKAIACAPDAQWRLLIALCRYAGLRCPSEVLVLRWQDVDFVGGVITIRSTKTGKRVMPILPELRPYLEDAFDPESDRCVSRYCESNSNMRKGFLQILKKAGLEAWPRLFHNLRGSLESDLAERYPIHTVVKWLGNSEGVAMRHYLRQSPAVLANVTSQGLGGQVGQKVGQRLGETNPLAGNEAKPAHKKSGKFNFPAGLMETAVPPRGGCPSDRDHAAGVSGPKDGPAAQIVKLWASLSETEQAEVLGQLLAQYSKR
jgi:integrase